MKVAIIGSGISGLTAAYHLCDHAEVSLFEKNKRLGGHTATVDVEIEGRHYPVDTGFIVYNQRTYPNFIRMLGQLDVATQMTTMGFSVSAEASGLEYSGGGFNGIFAQRKNLLNIKHWKMVWDILRFNRQAVKHLNDGVVDKNMLLGDYLKRFAYSQAFCDFYLVPMGAAIWSASTEKMLSFPMQFFIRFFDNHGLLQVFKRPPWFVIKGGSRQYIAPMIEGFKQNIHLGVSIEKVSRHEDGVTLLFTDGSVQKFDQVIFSCHSDEAIDLLADTTEQEQKVLGDMPYQMNEVVLHTDDSVLPSNKRTWSSWNYRLHTETQAQATLSYNMNILQGIQSPVTFCVTLNDSQLINPESIIGTYHYAHPVFTAESINAQQQWASINGVQKTWFAGAYWRNGFHEDGVVSGLNAANGIRELLGVKPIEVLNY